MRRSRPGVVRFHSGLGVSARNTQSGPDLGAGGELGDSARITSPGTDFGAGGELGGSTGTTSPGPGLGAAANWVPCSESPWEIPQRRTMYFLLRAPTPISTMWPNPFPI
ncbi:hypothetical protein D0O32_18680 [Pseudomonas aeruginosa]|nr:hypothetical protein D0O32_18680 [Pseudomonas aeruginosa]